MPFSHRPITSQDEGAKGGGLWQSRCSKSQKFISPHGVISKEVIKNMPSLTLKRHIWWVSLLCTSFIHLHIHKHFWNARYGKGIALHQKVVHLSACGATHSPSNAFNLLRDNIYSLARRKRAHLAQTHRLVIKPTWFSDYLEMNVNMCITDLLKEISWSMLDKDQ